jgi:glycosyltransferase involved in cell wall biosynthesis
LLPGNKKAKPSVSIVIPARNEEKNIENAINRISSFAEDMEIIFVEGHSTDNTWEEILRIQQKYKEKKILIAKQKGKGKGDAVTEGFKLASKDIFMILDADLTMPPEELPKYYQVLLEDKAEFVNGVRLVYPMDDKAMRFFNLCANKIFGLTFSWLLGQTVKDTLCGTKVFYRDDYLKIVANRHYFGNFDPFGDFDLLFGADKLNLKIVDVPIRYKNRQYGYTNIHRWRDGQLLLRMVGFAAKKLKFV